MTSEQRRISTAHVKNVTVTGDITILLTPSYYARQKASAASSVPLSQFTLSKTKVPALPMEVNAKSEMDLFNSNIEDLEYDTYQRKETVMPRKELKTSCSFLDIHR